MSLTNPLLGSDPGSGVSLLWIRKGRQVRQLKTFADYRAGPFEQQEIGKVYLFFSFIPLPHTSTGVYFAWDKRSGEEKHRVWSQRELNLCPWFAHLPAM